MIFTKQDVIKTIHQAKTIVDILEINKLTNSSLAAKYVADAIKSQYTILVIQTH